jgi:hypothetical protein
MVWRACINSGNVQGLQGKVHLVWDWQSKQRKVKDMRGMQRIVVMYISALLMLNLNIVGRADGMRLRSISYRQIISHQNIQLGKVNSSLPKLPKVFRYASEVAHAASSPLPRPE